MSTRLAQRIARLVASLDGSRFDAVVLTAGASITYVTDLRPVTLERLFAVVLRAHGGGGFVAPALDAHDVSGALPAQLQAAIYPPSSNGMSELCALLSGCRVVGIESRVLSHARAQALATAGFELRAADEVVSAQRARKDEHELRSLRNACELVEMAMRRTLDELELGMTEREVSSRAEALLRAHGATECVALTLFGPGSARPHGTPGDRPLAVGDVVCADLSARLDGYWGDLTRCATAGPASDWARQTWAALGTAHRTAVAAAAGGASAGKVEAAASASLADVPQLGSILHGAGHGIGLDVHEPPFLTVGAADLLEPGTVLAIEPGLYREGVGGLRLEDMVLVGETGPSTVSTLSRELQQVGA